MPRILKDWLSSFLEYSSESEAPSIYLKWVGMSCIAAALQRKVRLFWDSWTYPNEYILLVGPPASRKGTAMRFGRTVLEEAQIRLSCDSVSRKGFIEDLRSATNKDFITMNGSPMTHSSLTVYSEEFVVFLGADLQFIKDIVNLYDCPDNFTHRTQGGGIEQIQGAWVNIVGAITPSLLQTTLPNESIGGGLMSRIILVYSPRKEKKVVFPFTILEKDSLKASLVADLQDIYMMAGDFRVTDSFLEKWAEWYESYDEASHLIDPRMLGYADRKAKHALRLSMIASASRSSSMEVTAEDLVRVLEMLNEVEVLMPKALAGVGKSKYADITAQVEAHVHEVGETTISRLLEIFYHDVSLPELQGVVQGLQAMGKVKYGRREDGSGETDVVWRLGRG